MASSHEIGHLVWAKVQSHPWWPGQIMDILDAPKDVQVKQRPGYLLVSFFGDNKWAFSKMDRMVDFEPHYVQYEQQKGNKSWRQGVEEAKEVMDRRAGITPTTNHRPLDFQAKRAARNAAAAARLAAGQPAQSNVRSPSDVVPLGRQRVRRPTPSDAGQVHSSGASPAGSSPTGATAATAITPLLASTAATAAAASSGPTVAAAPAATTARSSSVASVAGAVNGTTSLPAGGGAAVSKSTGFHSLNQAVLTALGSNAGTVAKPLQQVPAQAQQQHAAPQQQQQAVAVAQQLAKKPVSGTRNGTSRAIELARSHAAEAAAAAAARQRSVSASGVPTASVASPVAAAAAASKPAGSISAPQQQVTVPAPVGRPSVSGAATNKALHASAANPAASAANAPLPPNAAAGAVKPKGKHAAAAAAVAAAAAAAAAAAVPPEAAASVAAAAAAAAAGAVPGGPSAATSPTGPAPPYPPPPASYAHMPIANWRNYLQTAMAGANDVAAVSGADALAWVRDMARGATGKLSVPQQAAARKQLTSFDFSTRTQALQHVTRGKLRPGRKSPRKSTFVHISRITVPESVPLATSQPQRAYTVPGEILNSSTPLQNVVLCVNKQVLPFLCFATVAASNSATREKEVHQLLGLPGVLHAYSAVTKYCDGWGCLAPGMTQLSLFIPSEPCYAPHVREEPAEDEDGQVIVYAGHSYASTTREPGISKKSTKEAAAAAALAAARRAAEEAGVVFDLPTYERAVQAHERAAANAAHANGGGAAGEMRRHSTGTVVGVPALGAAAAMNAGGKRPREGGATRGGKVARLGGAAPGGPGMPRMAISHKKGAGAAARVALAAAHGNGGVQPNGLNGVYRNHTYPSMLPSGGTHAQGVQRSKVLNQVSLSSLQGGPYINGAIAGHTPYHPSHSLSHHSHHSAHGNGNGYSHPSNNHTRILGASGHTSSYPSHPASAHNSSYHQLNGSMPHGQGTLSSSAAAAGGGDGRPRSSTWPDLRAGHPSASTGNGYASGVMRIHHSSTAPSPRLGSDLDLDLPGNFHLGGSDAEGGRPFGSELGLDTDFILSGQEDPCHNRHHTSAPQHGVFEKESSGLGLDLGLGDLEDISGLFGGDDFAWDSHLAGSDGALDGLAANGERGLTAGASAAATSGAASDEPSVLRARLHAAEVQLRREQASRAVMQRRLQDLEEELVEVHQGAQNGRNGCYLLGRESYKARVSLAANKVISQALQAPSLKGDAKQCFIQISRDLIQVALTLADEATRSLDVAALAHSLLGNALSDGLDMHHEDRWSFIQLATDLLQ